MAGMTPNAGRARLIEHAVGKRAPPSTFSLRLFTNNITVSATDVLATYTQMAAVQGYAAKTLTAASFTITVNDGSGYSVAAYAQQTFTFTGGTPVDIYGYYIVDTSDNVVIGAETFDEGVFTAENNGDNIKITPKLFFSTV